MADDVQGARVSGFWIDANAPLPLSAGIVLNNSSVEIDDTEITGAGVGVEIRGAASPSLVGNAIHDCLAEGVLISGSSTPWLSHNSILRNKGAGIAARDGARPALAGNVIEGNVLELLPGTDLETVRSKNFLLEPKAAPGQGQGNAGQGKMIAPAGRKLGKYEIRQKLGRGGMADVYLAQDSEHGEMLALKLIEYSPDADTRDSIEAERRGAELQAKLAAVDPRVVRVYDCGDIDGFFYVAMEYIDGQDLAELTRRGRLTPEFAAEVASSVAQTLENAHQLSVEIEGKEFHGIVHGDIKPKNIRIDARGGVRVLDFGIAKALSLSRRLTRNEFGSVPYASPERLDLGQVSVDSDLWSVAVMLYEMVTGLQPYQADTTERLERMIRSRVPPPPPPDPCPEPLRRILIKALAPDPDLRYATARELVDDLDAYRRGEPVSAALIDLDATRRTTPRQDADGDETRRTGPRENSAEGETRRTARGSVPPPARRSRLGMFRKTGRVLAVLLLAGMLYAAWAGISSYVLYQHGQALGRQIAAEQITDPNDIWNKWSELSGSNPSSFLLRGAANAGEAEARRGGGPRDRYLPEQRHGLREAVDVRTRHAGARTVDRSGQQRARQAAACRRAPRAHQRHGAPQSGGSQPGGGEI